MVILLVNDIQDKYINFIDKNKERNPFNKLKKINPLYITGGGLTIQAISTSCYSTSAVCTVG